MSLSTSSYPVVLPIKMQFFTCYTLSVNVDGLSVWILPICRNTGADKPKGHCVKSFVSTRQLSIVCIAWMPKVKEHTRICCIVSAHVCNLELLCTVYLHHNTSTHSDFSLLFIYDNAVIIVF